MIKWIKYLFGIYTPRFTIGDYFYTVEGMFLISAIKHKYTFGPYYEVIKVIRSQYAYVDFIRCSTFDRYIRHTTIQREEWMACPKCGRSYDKNRE